MKKETSGSTCVRNMDRAQQKQKKHSDSRLTRLQLGGLKGSGCVCVCGGTTFMLGAESGSIFTHRAGAFAELA